MHSTISPILCSVLMVNGDEFSGKKEKVISYYPNGVIKEKGTLKDGQKHKNLLIISAPFLREQEFAIK